MGGNNRSGNIQNKNPKDRKVLCRVYIGSFWYIAVVLVLFLFSCTTTRLYKTDQEDIHQPGVWHRIKEGQTLWRIARTYQVPLEKLKQANDIQDVVHISNGTWIFIPGADKVLYVQGNVENVPLKNVSKGFVWPVQGKVIREFGKQQNDFNYGIDIESKENKDIVATMDGVVVLSSPIRGYGNTIIIEHDDNFCSLYSRGLRSMVKEGQVVNTDTVIAKSGVPGGGGGGGGGGEDNVVHYELFYQGKPINPLYYLP